MLNVVLNSVYVKQDETVGGMVSATTASGGTLTSQLHLSNFHKLFREWLLRSLIGILTDKQQNSFLSENSNKSHIHF